MRKIPRVLFRYRLMTDIVALVLLLAALAVTPSEAQTQPMCDSGCINWNAQNGCVECQKCCFNPDTGVITCTIVPNKQCP